MTVNPDPPAAPVPAPEPADLLRDLPTEYAFILDAIRHAPGTPDGDAMRSYCLALIRRACAAEALARRLAAERDAARNRAAALAECLRPFAGYITARDAARRAGGMVPLEDGARVTHTARGYAITAGDCRRAAGALGAGGAGTPAGPGEGG